MESRNGTEGQPVHVRHRQDPGQRLRDAFWDIREVCRGKVEILGGLGAGPVAGEQAQPALQKEEGLCCLNCNAGKLRGSGGPVRVSR